MALTRKELASWTEYGPTPQEWALIRLMSHMDGEDANTYEAETR